ncbi:phage gp6-like head-tail connector protein [Spirosoma sp. BT702]|uniref:Phage gp6-like head-tail connector protein n=1 Tax=Spirosoma profusum TaxID=2771354 RepID=A0A927GB15_9BACT|nr:head-tail connector protein [Spirosoma profusum]MBD2705610.1 phage gp6-like head-tail connector protein [Spirosoma profusum]
MRYVFTSDAELPDVMDIPFLSGSWARAYGDDTVVNYLLKASMRYAEGFCDQPLFERSFTVKLPAFGCGGLLPGINANVTTITYDTALATGVSFDSTGYSVENGNLAFVRQATSILSPKQVIITYTAGYGVDKLPEDLGLALMLLVANHYDNRANPVSERRTAADSLLQNYKLY